MAAANSDTFKILISTDNHLGVWERDEMRKDDSFNTFEEVLQLALEQDVDMLLLGGDLFHENKPSRSTVVRTMDLLTKYCLGDRPIQFQVLSDPADTVVGGHINFESVNHNIGLPVFTIHGNHDDPTGTDALSAVNILSSASLVNYFGKLTFERSNGDHVVIAPILLQKDDTRIALYGLGNLRDERLARLLSEPGKVKWIRPEDTEEVPLDSWFNVFVLHQNRVLHTASAKNCVKESYLPTFLDMVVWGHEHECITDPWEHCSDWDPEASFHIMQPGSTVATALSEGESRPKHAVLLEVQGSQWRTVSYPLESVRPFVFESVNLNDYADLDPEAPESVPAFLEQRVEQLIDKAAQNHSPGAPELPLVRLRVDYTGFSTINTQRFGHKFVGRVANPNDIFLWQKAASRRKAAAAEAVSSLEELRPEQLDETRIEDLVKEHLQTSLEILTEQELSTALHEFVAKDEKSAIQTYVHKLLQQMQGVGAEDGQTDKGWEERLQEQAAQRAQQVASTSRGQALPTASAVGSQGAALPRPMGTQGAAIAADSLPRPAGRGRGRGRGQQSILNFAATQQTTQQSTQPAAKTRGPAVSPAASVRKPPTQGGAGRAAGRKRTAAVLEDSEEEDADDASDIDADENDENADGIEQDDMSDVEVDVDMLSEEEEVVRPTVSRSRRGSTAKKPLPVTKAATPVGAKKAAAGRRPADTPGSNAAPATGHRGQHGFDKLHSQAASMADVPNGTQLGNGGGMLEDSQVLPPTTQPKRRLPAAFGKLVSQGSRGWGAAK